MLFYFPSAIKAYIEVTETAMGHHHPDYGDPCLYDTRYGHLAMGHPAYYLGRNPPGRAYDGTAYLSDCVLFPTYTTSPIVLTDGIEHLLNPFRRIGVPAHELAMMMTIALRFIPTLLEETDRIMKAQTARGANFTSGSIMQRGRNMIPLLVPLFVSAFRRADDLATAMEARCYRGGEGRTRMHELAYTFRDSIAMVIVIGLTAVLVVMRWFV